MNEEDLAHWRLSRQKQTQQEIVLQKNTVIDVPVTATLGGGNEASFPEMLSGLTTKCFVLLDVS